MSRRFITHRRPGENVINPVADLAELQLVGVGDVEDRSLILVESQGHTYFYDYESTEAEDSPDVIQPTGGPGRWISTHRGLATAVAEHNDLEGIQGGAAGERYHVTEEQWTNLSDGPFRPLWNQPTTVAADEEAAVPENTELILGDELQVLGDLDVTGDLSTLPNVAQNYRRRHFEERVVSGHFVIPAGDYLHRVDYLQVDGSLDVQGDLFISDQAGLFGEGGGPSGDYVIKVGDSGGQVVYGGTDAADRLELHATAHVDGGEIWFHDDIEVRGGKNLVPETSSSELGTLGNPWATAHITTPTFGDMKLQDPFDPRGTFVFMEDGEGNLRIVNPHTKKAWDLLKAIPSRAATSSEVRRALEGPTS